MIHSKKFRVVISILALALFSLAVIFLNSGERLTYNAQTGSSYQKYEKAKVIRIINESLVKDEKISGLYGGTQEIEVKILTGEHKGETHKITNYLSNMFNVHAKPGLTITVCVDTADASMYTVSVYNYYRAPVLYGFIILLIALLWGIGGKKGLQSILGIFFTLMCIILLFIPMIYKGYSPIFASVLTGILTTCVTLYSLNGWSAKTLSAVIGTTLGVILAGIASSAACHLAHISAFNTEEAETMIIIARQTNMNIGELLFSGILIASLGAIMDMGMSIASSVYEMYTIHPLLTKKELFLSAINVGRDMMGTMSNTLILAFTGTSLNSLILLYSYNVPYNQLMNMNMLGIEIIQSLSGSIGVILTVPIIALVSSRIIPYMEGRKEVFPKKSHSGQNKKAGSNRNKPKGLPLQTKPF